MDTHMNRQYFNFRQGEKMVKKFSLAICFILLVTTHVWAQEENTFKVDVLAKTGASWDGRQLPIYKEGKPEITILRIQIPPKAQLPLHKHPVINAGVMLKGELTVVTEKKEKLHLKAGDAIVEVVDKWHYGKNEGDGPAEIIVFYAGVEGIPITIKE